jgi:hypothetical protein
VSQSHQSSYDVESEGGGRCGRAEGHMGGGTAVTLGGGLVPMVTVTP